jgi:hypothetical protein
MQVRMLGAVQAVHDGQADLLMQYGQRILFAESKLATINCSLPGAKVWLYVVDLGGTDELVRARAAVDVIAKKTERKRPDGLFGSRPAQLTRSQFVALQSAGKSGRLVPPPTLSGVRLAP